MAEKSNNDAAVVIVGAGPVGLVAALTLARGNVPVTVLEAGDRPNPASRASTIHATTLEILDALGIAWNVIRRGNIVRTIQYRSRKQGHIATFEFDILRGITPFPFRLQVDQENITQSLLDALSTYPNAQILFNTPAEQVTTTDTSATVRATDGRTFTGSFVLGCDGSHSVVRKSADIPFPGATYPTRYFTAFTTCDVLGAMPELSEVTYIFDRAEGVSVIDLPDHTRVAFHVDASFNPDPDSLHDVAVAKLRNFIPALPDDCPLQDVLNYAIHRRTATRFRAGRIILAGDAAHLNSPTGGMGMNSGIHDAYLAGIILTSVVHGEISDTALDGYAERRRSVAEAYVQARAEKNLAAVEGDEEDNPRYIQGLRNAMSDRRSQIRFLLRSSMFDSAPRVTPEW